MSGACRSKSVLAKCIAAMAVMSTLSACQSAIDATVQTQSITPPQMTQAAKKGVRISQFKTVAYNVRSYAYSSRLVIGEQALDPKPAMKRAYLGGSPFVCGPSGFGRRSRCFSRI